MEAVRIACAGFPTRKAFRPFAIRYNILLASGRGAYRHLDPETLQEEEAAEISRKVLQAVKIIGWQMGKTRVFLRAGQLAQLEVNLICSKQSTFGRLGFLWQHACGKHSSPKRQHAVMTCLVWLSSIMFPIIFMLAVWQGRHIIQAPGQHF